MKNKKTKIIIDYALVIFGTACSAFSMACFALPYDMVVAGVSGIGRMVNYGTGMSVSLAVLIINVFFFIIGWAVLGKRFAASILIATFVFPFVMDVCQRVPALMHLVDDPLLAAICAGIIDGFGLGIVIRVGGSTGGIDIPCIILNKKKGIPIAKAMYAIDVAIFITQIAITNSNGIILGILYALIYSIVMNKIIVMSEGGVQLMIFSKDNVETINEKLLHMGYGTSLIGVKGGYLQNKYDMLYCVATSRNLNRIKKAVLAIDEYAFSTISNVSEVNGNGFTKEFYDEDYVAEATARNPGIIE